MAQSPTGIPKALGLGPEKEVALHRIVTHEYTGPTGIFVRNGLEPVRGDGRAAKTECDFGILRKYIASKWSRILARAKWPNIWSVSAANSEWIRPSKNFGKHSSDREY